MSTLEKISKFETGDLSPTPDELSEIFEKLSIDFEEAVNRYEKLVREVGEK